MLIAMRCCCDTPVSECQQHFHEGGGLWTYHHDKQRHPCHVQDLKDTLIYTRISGYGQTGPKAQLAGYASVCEAYGGIRCSRDVMHLVSRSPPVLLNHT